MNKIKYFGNAMYWLALAHIFRFYMKCFLWFAKHSLNDDDQKDSEERAVEYAWWSMISHHCYDMFMSMIKI